MFTGLSIPGSALTAETLRMSVIAENLANIDTTATPGGGPYRRQFVVLSARAGGPQGIGDGVEVAAVLPDPSPFKVVYDPQNPLADAQGNVLYPNVHLATEMVDLIAASRAYSANATAFNAVKSQAVKALSIGA
jgi:flagellar basal-body rod protein FlgC